MSLFSATAVFFLIISIAAVAKAQTSTPSCAQNLIPCAQYMNSTNPPDTCCKPIRETVANDRACLCNLYNDPTFLPSLHINLTQALNLTKACGVDPNTSLCSNVSALSPGSSGNVPPPPPPPENDARRIMWIGVPSFVVLWVSMLLY